MQVDRGFDSNADIFSIPALLTGTIFTAALRPLMLGISMLTLSHAFSAQAVEVAPFTGHRFGGSFADSNSAANFVVADAAAFGLVLDFDLEPDKQIEIFLSRQNTHLSTGDLIFTGNPLFDLTIEYFHIGGLYMMPGSERVRPFLSGTFGLTHMAPKRSDLTTENRLSISLGTGAKFFFNKNLGLRFDLRAIYTALNADTEIFCSGGCAIKVYSSGFVQTEVGAALMVIY